ncbi:MAG: ankyrin repeat domain-containing protein, partial [Candidatus Hydrogenedentes bacterium]|nr:ankyrin repeat domain-containing protein [Candidatus Hydrogenedentota bacterium]
MTRDFRGENNRKAARFLPCWGGGLVLFLAACGCGASTDNPAEKTALGLPPFHLSAREGDLETVREHLESGSDANVRDIDGNTALHRAARDGRLAIAQLLLDFRADPDARTGTGWTPLHLAIRGDRTELVELLLRYSADPNIANAEGVPPLHLAVMKGNEAMVRHLLTSRPVAEIQKRQK